MAFPVQRFHFPSPAHTQHSSFHGLNIASLKTRGNRGRLKDKHVDGVEKKRAGVYGAGRGYIQNEGQQSKQAIHSPLTGSETQEAVQSKNTTRANIVCPLSAARTITTDTGKKESAAEVAPRGQKERQSRSKLLLLAAFYRRGGQTPNSTLKY